MGRHAWCSNVLKLSFCTLYLNHLKPIIWAHKILFLPDQEFHFFCCLGLNPRCFHSNSNQFHHSSLYFTIFHHTFSTMFAPCFQHCPIIFHSFFDHVPAMFLHFHHFSPCSHHFTCLLDNVPTIFPCFFLRFGWMWTPCRVPWWWIWAISCSAGPTVASNPRCIACCRRSRGNGGSASASSWRLGTMRGEPLIYGI